MLSRACWWEVNWQSVSRKTSRATNQNQVEISTRKHTQDFHSSVTRSTPLTVARSPVPFLQPSLEDSRVRLLYHSTK